MKKVEIPIDTVQMLRLTERLLQNFRGCRIVESVSVGDNRKGQVWESIFGDCTLKPAYGRNVRVVAVS